MYGIFVCDNLSVKLILTKKFPSDRTKIAICYSLSQYFLAEKKEKLLFFETTPYLATTYNSAGYYHLPNRLD